MSFGFSLFCELLPYRLFHWIFPDSSDFTTQVSPFVFAKDVVSPKAKYPRSLVCITLINLSLPRLPIILVHSGLPLSVSFIKKASYSPALYEVVRPHTIIPPLLQ